MVQKALECSNIRGILFFLSLAEIQKPRWRAKRKNALWIPGSPGYVRSSFQHTPWKTSFSCIVPKISVNPMGCIQRWRFRVSGVLGRMTAGLSDGESWCSCWDNESAISLTTNPTHHATMKHVDIQLQFIRDHVKKGTIDVEYCPTGNMLADLMTKGLPHELHKRLLGLMGVGQTTTPSPVEDTTKSGEDPGMESPSGSVELRRHHAGNGTVMNYARWTTRYGLSDMEYPILNIRNEGALVKDGASRFG